MSAIRALLWLAWGGSVAFAVPAGDAPPAAAQEVALVPLPLKEFRAETIGDVASSQNCAVSPGTRETQRIDTTLGLYEYEAKPDHPALAIFNPRKAPAPGSLLLRPGDRLAICGDSITEQRMYPRIIETYLTACTPQLAVSVRQYGMSGETIGGFLGRMERDCLQFAPTIATLNYGMNDARYRPFDVVNGLRFEDQLRVVVRRLKQAGVRVVVGSPSCAGRIAHWVHDRAGTLDQQNIHLCALRDLAIGVAISEDAAFADVFWPMLLAQTRAPERYPPHRGRPYEVAGEDGIHPDWAGQLIMAYAYLTACGLDGDLARIKVDLAAGKASVSPGHHLQSYAEGTLQLVSERYPFCAHDPVDRDDSVRSGTTLVPFFEHLSRFTLQLVGGAAPRYRVTWGEQTRGYSRSELAEGVNLAQDFPVNPFSQAFARIDAAVATKQAYETKQVKTVFHSPRGKQDFQRAVAETEAERATLVEAIRAAHVPIQHVIAIAPEVDESP